jgi:hypothetical protein
MDGVSASKSTFVVTDIKAFIKGIEADRIKLSVTAHKTRSSKEIYYLEAHIADDSNRLYFALPAGVKMEALEDEKPKLILKIPTNELGVASSADMAEFESDYREFMKSKVEPLIVTAAGFDAKKTMHLANFAKADGVASKFALLNLPKSIKPDQITRLVEAAGSRILVTIAYMYVLDDVEKGRAVYGATLETGRFPFIEKDKSAMPPIKKRKAEFHQEDSEERETPKWVEPPVVKDMDVSTASGGAP